MEQPKQPDAATRIGDAVEQVGASSGVDVGGTGQTVAGRDVGAGEMNPGDEAAPGTPGTGENLCPDCSGNGHLKSGEPCRTCGSTGLITQAVSGGA